MGTSETGTEGTGNEETERLGGDFNCASQCERKREIVEKFVWLIFGFLVAFNNLLLVIRYRMPEQRSEVQKKFGGKRSRK